jgi:hypothetical protein
MKLVAVNYRFPPELTQRIARATEINGFSSQAEFVRTALWQPSPPSRFGGPEPKPKDPPTVVLSGAALEEFERTGKVTIPEGFVPDADETGL